ncbi:MAG: molecular chaperone HscB [bacterium]|jgi:molecular chaperone HscB
MDNITLDKDLHSTCSLSSPSGICEQCQYHHHCTECSRTLDSPLYCFSCSKIQKKDEIPNYFSIFSLDPNFEVNTDALVDKQDDLLIALHPDLYHLEDTEEQSLSINYCALLNEAKGILENPFKRGKYLLSLFLEGQAPKLDAPQDFIFEMFELQEEIDDLKKGDSQVDLLKNQVAEMITSLTQELTESFKKLKKPTQPNLVDKLSGALAKLKFILNIEERLNNL